MKVKISKADQGLDLIYPILGISTCETLFIKRHRGARWCNLIAGNVADTELSIIKPLPAGSSVTLTQEVGL